MDAGASREASLMSITLNEILALVGRLDDSPGFDTPRERFRRFLLERVTDAGVARSLIDQSQRALGEQHQRALQDAIVVLGRFLGFETVFGTDQRVAGGARYGGQWRSRRRLAIVLEVCTDQTPRSDVEELSRSLSAVSAPSQPDVRHVGLCIVTPMYGGRARLEEALLEKPQPDLRVVSIRSLLWLADMVSAERLQHHEILRLFTSGVGLDFIVDLMERLAAGGQDDRGSRALVQAVSPPARSEAAHWVATIGHDETATPEQFVESVIRGRQILGVTDVWAANGPAGAGDWICFCVHGKGTVGHARVDSIISGAGLIRGSHRFTAVFRLKNVEIYDAPIGLSPETERKRLGERSQAEDRGPFLASVSPEEFAELTAHALDSRSEEP
jgi:hypothetical protein